MFHIGVRYCSAAVLSAAEFLIFAGKYIADFLHVFYLHFSSRLYYEMYLCYAAGFFRVKCSVTKKAALRTVYFI